VKGAGDEVRRCNACSGPAKLVTNFTGPGNDVTEICHSIALKVTFIKWLFHDKSEYNLLASHSDYFHACPGKFLETNYISFEYFKVASKFKFFSCR
jgi:hypothetical protein